MLFGVFHHEEEEVIWASWGGKKGRPEKGEWCPVGRWWRHMRGFVPWRARERKEGGSFRQKGKWEKNYRGKGLKKVFVLERNSAGRDLVKRKRVREGLEKLVKTGLLI